MTLQFPSPVSDYATGRYAIETLQQRFNGGLLRSPYMSYGNTYLRLLEAIGASKQDHSVTPDQRTAKNSAAVNNVFGPVELSFSRAIESAIRDRDNAQRKINDSVKPGPETSFAEIMLFAEIRAVARNGESPTIWFNQATRASGEMRDIARRAFVSVPAGLTGLAPEHHARITAEFQAETVPDELALVGSLNEQIQMSVGLRSDVLQSLSNSVDFESAARFREAADKAAAIYKELGT